MPDVAEALAVVDRTARLDPHSRKIYLRILPSMPSASHRAVMARVRKIGGPKKRIVIELGRNNAAKLGRLAERKGTTADKLANEALLAYVRKHGR